MLPVRNEVVGLAKETAGGQVKGRLVSAQSHQAKGAYDRPLRPALLAYFGEPIDCVCSVYMCLCVSVCLSVCLYVSLCVWVCVFSRINAVLSHTLTCAALSIER